MGSRTLAHQHSLYTLVHQPGRAKTMKGVLQAYEIWDRDMRDYQFAWGQAPPEATKCVIALQMLPADTNESLILACALQPL